MQPIGHQLGCGKPTDLSWKHSLSMSHQIDNPIALFVQMRYFDYNTFELPDGTI